MKRASLFAGFVRLLLFSYMYAFVFFKFVTCDWYKSNPTASTHSIISHGLAVAQKNQLTL